MKRIIQVAVAATVAAWVSGCAVPNMNVGAIQASEPSQSAPEPPRGIPPVSSPMPAGTIAAELPAGFISFCIRFQDQCAAPSNPQNTVTLTPANWSILTAVNEQTNDAITPEDDMEHYGRAEYWDIPTDGRGNCKDYALTKRKLLIEAGLPALALRIAIVLTPSGERHAVLTIATDQGDYVLDNLTGEIRPWSQAGYSWIERQASNSPWNWVAFQNGTTQWETASLAATPTGPVSSTRDFLPAVLQ